MNEQAIDRVKDELAAALTGATLVRVYQLSALRFALDLRSSDAARPLLFAAEPARPRAYLTSRPPRELERGSTQASHFTLLLRKHLGGARLIGVMKDADERVLRFAFRAQDELGATRARTLVAQLTGRSSNIFLLDDDSRIIGSLRPARGEGQEIGETYNPPRPLPPAVDAPARTPRTNELTALVLASTGSPSEVIEEFDDTRDRLARFREKSNVALARLRRELDKRTRLRGNIDADLREHGSADAHKRRGDLLLANLANAERTGSRVRVTDYFADDAPVVELEVDENKPLQQIAAELFSRYARSKRAHEEAARRRVALDAEIDDYTARIEELESVIAAADEARFDELFPAPDKAASRARPSNKQIDKRPERKHAPDHIPGTRRYRSSDSFEIVVGRGAKENDAVTFRLARPNDLWLHAADYPGAHVIVRNHTKLEVPHRTLVEAAQLAAAYSQAKDDSKVSVNYTPRKFISKPKGSAPGLVKLAQFKTLLVEPREAGERITT